MENIKLIKEGYDSHYKFKVFLPAEKFLWDIGIINLSEYKKLDLDLYDSNNNYSYKFFNSIYKS